MDCSELNWRVEEACMNAWPASRQLLLGGWLLRASGGDVRRANSVNPLRGGPRDPAKVLAAAESVYAALEQPTIFRTPDIAEGMAERLAELGYLAESETATLYCNLSGKPGVSQGAAELTPTPSREWLRARAALSAVDAEGSQLYAAMLAGILPAKAFAAVRHEGEIAALAYAVVHDGLAVIESVVTDTRWRRRGYGRRAIGELLDWARAAGAQGACLQVLADNTPALALYRTLGFDRTLYCYRYLRKGTIGQRQAKVAS
ncbi:MAG: GNAT family N-acetyltransferase [Kiloniellaceae bacterium]|nr:GNAT family N-acetyltransferase [Kiloniellaceae bacterium]